MVTRKNPRSKKVLTRLKHAVKNKDTVAGLTHNYYRYPARFSPKFVREVIELFSDPGDVILDPFVGGGTTLVEALAANRHSIGFDVSPIATFVSKAKTLTLSDKDLEIVRQWCKNTLLRKIRGFTNPPSLYKEQGYLSNVPWTLQRCINIFLEEIELLSDKNQIQFVQCILLKTSQWAIDCRKSIPSADEFRKTFLKNLNLFIKGANELSNAVTKNAESGFTANTICLNESIEQIDFQKLIKQFPSLPKLVITSPPYVGVQILYHQWQVNSRKRTRAPFWIINSLDGQGSGFYTFGHYRGHGKKTYFEIAENVFKSLKSYLDPSATVVQLVGFSNPRYLQKYLKMMENSGFEEVSLMKDGRERNKRIWRSVPNRKWYVNSNNQISSSKEVLLIHRLK